MPVAGGKSPAQLDGRPSQIAGWSSQPDGKPSQVGGRWSQPGGKPSQIVHLRARSRLMFGLEPWLAAVSKAAMSVLSRVMKAVRGGRVVAHISSFGV